MRIHNYARCVRAGNVILDPDGTLNATRPSIVIESGGNQQSQPGGMSGQGGPPPSEALKACVGNNQGTSCQFAAPQGAVVGTCALIQQELACVPVGAQLDPRQPSDLSPHRRLSEPRCPLSVGVCLHYRSWSSSPEELGTYLGDWLDKRRCLYRYSIAMNLRGMAQAHLFSGVYVAKLEIADEVVV